MDSNIQQNTQVTHKSVPNTGIGKILYSFITPECRDHKRGNTWFIGMGLVVLLAVFWGIFEQSLSIVLLAILLGGMYTITHNKPSADISVKFTDIGLQWKEKFFLYQSITAFWIIWKPEDGVFTLHIIMSSGLLKELVIPIQNQDPAKIREILGYYVPEIEGREERFTDLIIRMLKL